MSDKLPFKYIFQYDYNNPEMTTNVWPQVRPKVVCRGVLYADIPNTN